MITEAQVADLQPGDVVRVTGWYGVNVEGPLSEGTKSLWLGQHLLVRDCDGSVGHWAKPDATLTVVSRAPRPVYMNSDRTEPVAGDIVRNDEDLDDRRTWMFRANTDSPEWTTHVGRDGPCNVIETHQRRPSLPRHLRLLVDGETGQVVP